MKYFVWILSGILVSCATSNTETYPPSSIPRLMSAIHPTNTNMEDVQQIFTSENIAAEYKTTKFYQECDQTITHLDNIAIGYQAISEAVEKMIAKEPLYYHYCFYARLVRLNNQLLQEESIKEKQKLMIQGFSVLAPLARAYFNIYHDSRYLRWATSYYQKMSEPVFFRKTTLTPQGTQELVGTNEPLGLYPIDSSFTQKPLSAKPTTDNKP